MLSIDPSYPEHSGIVFLKSFYLLIQNARLYQDNNQLIQEGLARFKGLLEEMTREEDLNIQIWRGRFHIGGERLPYRRDAVSISTELIEYFAARSLGGLHFYPNTRKIPLKTLIKFIRLFDISVKQEAPFAWLEKRINTPEFSWVEISREQNGELNRQERAKKAYSFALTSIKEVADKTSKGVTGVRKVRRLAQNIVDLVQEDQSLILGLATLKAYDDYTYTHSVNVSLLATCLGRYIGLNKVTLEQLCVCGLFHDLGKVEVSKKVLLKKGKLTEEEWKSMRSHPLLGVRNILRLNANKAMRSKIILGPFEHHLNPDMTGYPKTHFMKKMSLVGKILRIADVYEALTSSRVYRPRPFTPNEALRKMWSEGSRTFDPILLKSFISMMGIYPVGSVVELNNGQIGLVKDYPKESQKDQPKVQMLDDDFEERLTGGETVFLANRPSKQGFSSLRIVRDLQPSQLGVPVAKFFLEEKEGKPSLVGRF